MALKVPTVSDSERTGIPLDSLKSGRDLYIRHCASCHTLYLPERFTAQEWTGIVDRMEVKAKLNEHQKSLILNYLQAVSSGNDTIREHNTLEQPD